MRCDARVEDALQTFPNTKIVYHTTKQCEEIASHKYSIDDGDSEMLLCGGCFRRCLTNKNKNTSWLGFFDCSYPPEAKVKGSNWYFWTLSNSPASSDDEEMLSDSDSDSYEEEEEEEESDRDELCNEMTKCSLQEVVQEEEVQEEEEEVQEEEEEVQEEEEEVQEEEEEVQEEVQKLSVADEIRARIASLEAFVKTSRSMPLKEQVKIHKIIINLRTELKKGM
jgi:hypothetical protein